MYAWGFGIWNMVTIGRTWEQFFSLLSEVYSILNISVNQKLVVYIHNLPYEFQFIRKHLKWDKVFLLDTRKPVKAELGGIELKCSLKLSGKRLELLSDDLVRYKAKKMVGDLDYSKIRLSETPMTKKELKYLENDVRVVLYYIQERIEQDGGIDQIPLTKTGYVRELCRKSCFSRFKRYRAKIEGMKLQPDEYKQLKRAFQGGFTHANYIYSRNIVKNVGSYDFTSAYPAVMLSEKFPMSSAKFIGAPKSEYEFINYLNNYCCLFDIRFFNLRPKFKYEHIISQSKCWELENPWVNNGRVVKASRLATTVTEQDYFAYLEFYDFDEFEIFNMRIYEKDYLPKSFVSAVLKLYQNKTRLKGVESETLNYMLSKNMLNAAYGMTVTDPVRDELEYVDDEYTSNPVNLNDAIEKYNTGVKRFLFYPWGVWVTAYNRSNLYSAILEFGSDYVYSDTDSIKAINCEKHVKYIEDYNAHITQKLKDACSYWNFDWDLFAPKTIKGEVKQLGLWDYEGKYDRFKTLGAKRYLVEKNGKYELTVAGVNKEKAMKYMQTKALDPFDIFDDELLIPSDWSGKNTLTYIDIETEGDIADYLGNVQHYHELSSIHMEPAEYNLSMSEHYLNFLKGVEEASW